MMIGQEEKANELMKDVYQNFSSSEDSVLLGQFELKSREVILREVERNK